MASKFLNPVRDTRLTSKFGWREIGRGKEWHQGIDLAGPRPGMKVPVYAAEDGVVKACGPLSSYGNRILLNHTLQGKTWETNYAHLDSIKVKKGERVKRGDVIGIMGNTGGSFGVHLHFEIHNGVYAPGQPNAVDPMKYIDLKDNVSTKSVAAQASAPVAKKETKVTEDDDTMKFTNDATKNAIRDHVDQMVKGKYIDVAWLKKFDEGTLTVGDYEGLKLIVDQKKAKKK